MLVKTVDFAKYSSLKIGSKIAVHVVQSVQEEPKGVIIGAANNLLVSNTPPPLFMLGDRFDFVRLKDGVLHVGCALSSGRLVSFARKNDIAGFEFLAGLPGSVGGIIAMNAGLKEWQISDNLIEVFTKDGWIKKSDIGFEYRKSAIKSAIFEAKFEAVNGFDESVISVCKKIRSNQPKLPSAGSCFKNPKDNYAGALIEDVGLRGHFINAVGFSKKHANFLINKGGGTYKDAILCINLARQKVWQKHRIKLQCEVQIIDINDTLEPLE